MGHDEFDIIDGDDEYVSDQRISGGARMHGQKHHPGAGDQKQGFSGQNHHNKRPLHHDHNHLGSQSGEDKMVVVSTIHSDEDVEDLLKSSGDNLVLQHRVPPQRELTKEVQPKKKNNTA